MQAPKGIGIYAGSFDPIHNGHLTFALAAARVCGLTKVIFLPERMPRGKPGVTDFAHRVAMIRLAIHKFPNLEVQELDASQFSVEHTLPELQKLHGDRRLTLLVGSDNAVNMNPVTWPNVDHLYKTTDLAVGMRHGHEAAHLSDLAKKANVTLIYTGYAQAAATKVRGGDFDLLHPLVAQYATDNQLY